MRFSVQIEEFDNECFGFSNTSNTLIMSVVAFSTPKTLIIFFYQELIFVVLYL